MYYSNHASDDESDRIQQEVDQAVEAIIGKGKVQAAVEEGHKMVEIKMPAKLLPALKLMAKIAEVKRKHGY